MMQELSLLTPFVDMSKKGISTATTVIVENAIENGSDVLNLCAIGSKMEQFGKELKEKVAKHPECINELLRYDNKKRVASNVELSVREVGTKYDYSATVYLSELDSKMDEIKEEQKVIQDIAKIIKTRTEYTTKDGEQIIIMPAGKSSTTSIVTKIL